MGVLNTGRTYTFPSSHPSYFFGASPWPSEEPFSVRVVSAPEQSKGIFSNTAVSCSRLTASGSSSLSNARLTYFWLISYPYKTAAQMSCNLEVWPEPQKGQVLNRPDTSRVDQPVRYFLRKGTRVLNIAGRNRAICHTVLAVSLVKAFACLPWRFAFQHLTGLCRRRVGLSEHQDIFSHYVW